MSRLDELIRELCSNGVPRIHLGDVTHEGRERNAGRAYTQVRSVTNSRGLVPTSDFFDNTRTSEDTSNYKVVRTGMYVYNPSRINVGSVAWLDEPSPVIVSPMYVVFGLDTSRLAPDFLQLFLASTRGRRQIEGKTEVGARFRLTYDTLSTLRIPLPPLEVQREIVRILDLFTTLEAELEAELEARRRQYAHYRDSLLTFPEGGVRWVPMGDLLREPLTNGRSVPDGTGYPVLRLTALRGPVVDTSHRKLGAWGQEAGSRFRIEAGDLLIVRGNGSKDLIARACMVEDSEEVAFPDTMIRVRPDLEQVSQRYLFHIWESRAARSRIVRLAKRTSGVWKISQDDIARVELPLPPLEEQARIVTILDSFDALVNDLSIGLPAELAARRKQYEHYRDRLLTFKEAAA